jgi:8-oxo-dGTP pyrophosphatase MutT (NUDIX family)
MSSSAEPPVRRIGSRVVYRNNWMSVREDDIEFADGTRSIYGVLDKDDYAVVIAVEESPDGARFHLVEQYRYAIERRSLEFPMGGWPAGKSGTAEELARAELREETGITADTWTHLGHLVQSTGHSSQGFDVYLATGLTAGAHEREATESDMEHRVVSEAEFCALVAAGTITDSPTVASYGLLLLHRQTLASSERQGSAATAAH